MESFGIISTLHNHTGSRETIRVEGTTCWLLGNRVSPLGPPKWPTEENGQKETIERGVGETRAMRERDPVWVEGDEVVRCKK